MNDPTKRYFEDLLYRAAVSDAVPRRAADHARPNECHANCERFAAANANHAVVRGWLVVGGHFFIPHSVICERQTGTLVDITPDPSNSGAIPFVAHVGSEEDFQTLRIGRDGGFLYPELDISSA